jgi:hypothetical protein
LVLRVQVGFASKGNFGLPVPPFIITVRNLEYMKKLKEKLEKVMTTKLCCQMEMDKAA